MEYLLSNKQASGWTQIDAYLIHFPILKKETELFSPDISKLLPGYRRHILKNKLDLLSLLWKSKIQNKVNLCEKMQAFHWYWVEQERSNSDLAIFIFSKNN
jgi:hypothetical protein